MSVLIFMCFFQIHLLREYGCLFVATKCYYEILRLKCVNFFFFRYKERERVMSTFESDLHLPVTCIDASDQFLTKLKGVKDPETKRKIIGREFIAVFDEFAQGLESKLGKRPEYLVQGTLYPDVIESCPPPGSGRSHSHTIKSHHNVGGLPKDMKLKLIEPLKLLFKDEVTFLSVVLFVLLALLFLYYYLIYLHHRMKRPECNNSNCTNLSCFSLLYSPKVRKLGSILNVPESFLKRHPFPGPGLAVRVLGDVTAGNALETLRQVFPVSFAIFICFVLTFCY